MHIPMEEFSAVPPPESFWHPPQAGRFFSLDSSDEHWARPLGLGRVMTLAQFTEHLRDKLERHMYKQMCLPVTFLGQRF